jgi:membrane carboxypeptidase/penicillin-binding protein PbpC
MQGRGPAPGSTDPPPRPFRARSGDTLPDVLIPGLAPPGSTGDQETRPERPRPGRLRRRIRRTVAALGALALLAIAAFGSLLLITPSAGRAQAIVRARDRAYHVAYPGPPVPARFAAALVATEDHRFYSDPGIDPIAAGRVALGYLTGHGAQQGGATITQQLAKMLYTPGHSGLASEIEQVVMAVKLNFSYSKAQILQMYADVAYFGQNHYSLGAASCGYFGVAPARLTWSQAAMLAGLVQAPSGYDPLTHPALAREREAHVLGRLVATGTLSQPQARAALAQPLRLVPARLARAAPGPGRPTCGRTRT